MINSQSTPSCCPGQNRRRSCFFPYNPVESQALWNGGLDAIRAVRARALEQPECGGEGGERSWEGGSLGRCPAGALSRQNEAQSPEREKHPRRQGGQSPPNSSAQGWAWPQPLHWGEAVLPFTPTNTETRGNATERAFASGLCGAAPAGSRTFHWAAQEDMPSSTLFPESKQITKQISSASSSLG